MSNPMKCIRFVGRTFLSLFIVVLLLTCRAGSAQNEGHRIRNIVLVHGAWADGSGWKGVYEILIKDGYNVGIVQEPETSFKDDVTATKRALALQDGPCILVGHSYGGAVITKAGTDSSVAGLVYVAAHMPDAGENEGDDGKRFPSDLSRSGAIILRSFMSTSQPTCLPSRPLSWRDRRCSTLSTISRRSSSRLRGEANQAGWS
jgi:pimeloyl-ACP methyl ester carboxylesterase